MSERKYEYNDRRTLKAFLEDAGNFSLVLPHFQRNFVWDAKEKQKSLLQSMLAGIPIGSILLLKDERESYASRPLCFKECFKEFEPKIEGDECTFLLDGQQRMSTLKSMFCDLFSEEEVKKLKKDDWLGLWEDLPSQLRYRWFLKIDLDNDDENDIWGINDLEFKESHKNGKPFSPDDFDKCIERKKVNIEKSKNPKSAHHPDSSRDVLETWAISNNLVPLYLLNTHRRSFVRILEGIARRKHVMKPEIQTKEKEKEYENKINNWADKVTESLQERTLRTGIPSIILKGKTGMEVGIYIFEQVNRAGVKLDIYDLLVARMAHKNVNLTEKMEQLCKPKQSVKEAIYDGEKNTFDARNMGIWDDDSHIPEDTFKKAFKNCLAICNLKNKDGLRDNLSDKYIKENHLLQLTAEEIYDNWEETVLTLFSVLQFLHFRCGVVKLKDIPYELLIVPLFVFFIKYKDQLDRKAVNKIEFWYWASIFSGHYRDKQATRIIEDSKIIINYENFNKSEEFQNRCDKIFKDIGYSDKESLTREKGNSRYERLDKAINQYVLSKEPWDLLPNERFIKLTAYYFPDNDIDLDKNIHHIIPLNEIASQGDEDIDELKKNTKHPVNSALNKVIISRKANLKILRVSDYEKHREQLSFQTNMIPVPTEKKFVNRNKSYNLNKFLLARFDLIEKNVKNDLQKLIAKPPLKSESKTT